MGKRSPTYPLKFGGSSVEGRTGVGNGHGGRRVAVFATASSDVGLEEPRFTHSGCKDSTPKALALGAARIPPTGISLHLKTCAQFFTFTNSFKPDSKHMKWILSSPF